MYLSVTGEEGGEDEEAAEWSDAEPTKQRQFLRLTGPSTNTLEFESNLFQTDSQKRLVVLFQFELSCGSGSSGSSLRRENGSN